MNRDYKASSPLQDPSLGLGDPDSAAPGRPVSAVEKTPAKPHPASGVNVPAVILSAGLSSVFCLALGFLAGQELGTPVFLKRESGEQASGRLEKKLADLLSTELAALKTELSAGNRQDSRVAADFRSIGEELKEKLVSTHNLYAGLTDLPVTLSRLERLILKWEERKVSIVEEICPASPGLPASYPGEKKAGS